ncbi:protein-disulfide reductase DsbD [Zwartia sp.]|uniref:protein-disulfide reductase DsbD n=1 Tax=Zwartia sp. TaxID=2978004 RepID=UPI002716B965|nr:protein-disulfide reductase DsbD [Zwartia sp.]MDO9024521.1 protein-disulfide reductase DsbD [Zwartia sp.]
MKYFYKLLRHFSFAFLCIGLIATFQARASQDDFLDPEKAFVLTTQMSGDETIQLRFKIANGYYMYRERFSFKLDTDVVTLGEAKFPIGEVKYDPTFDKKMELYFREAVLLLPISPWPKDKNSDPFVLTVTGQGCAVAGICYPPMDFIVKVQAGADGRGYVIESSTAQLGFFERIKQGQWSELLLGGDDVKLADVLSSTGAIEIVFLFFVLGLLLALTPCVLPMLPILSVLLVGEEHHVSRIRGLALAFGYVAGMSVVYTALGVAAGLSGAGLAAWLQTPWVLGFFALMLAILAMAMFDVYTLQMPSVIQSRLMARNSRILGGRMSAAVLMGALSALIVGPCVAAPLAGALLYISQTGDVWLGGSALFAMAWGMGVPLLLMGGTSGKLMPRTGPWMEGVKKFFGILLLATAWWMVTPLLATWLQILGWAILTMFTAVLMRTFEPLGQEAGIGSVLRKTLGLLLVVLSAVWLLGIASGGRSLLQPLSHLSLANRVSPIVPASATSASQQLLSSKGSTGKNGSLSTNSASPAGALIGVNSQTPFVTPAAQGHPVFQRVRTVEELERLLAQSTQPVMLDFYADWCVACKEMEAFTFTDSRVAQRMNQMLLLQVDVTANNPDDRALMKKFRLFGPPGIIFFKVGGLERKDVRVIGFQDATRFSANLDKVLN